MSRQSRASPTRFVGDRGRDAAAPGADVAACKGKRSPDGAVHPGSAKDHDSGGLDMLEGTRKGGTRVGFGRPIENWVSCRGSELQLGSCPARVTVTVQRQFLLPHQGILVSYYAYGTWHCQWQ